MPRSNFDHTSSDAGDPIGGESCPKCGALMELIDSAVEGLPMRLLQLCPACYLVIWNDETGFQVRQGVPVKQPAAKIT